MVEVINPATEEVIESVDSATAEDADAAIDRAKAAFPGWRDVEPADSARLLRRLAEALDAERENLVRLESQNVGKPIASARGEIDMVVETFNYYAGAPERLLGDTIPVAGGIDMTFREPLGVVGLITPWNFPLNIASWKLAPALACGNTAVMKPAEATPLTTLRLAELPNVIGIKDSSGNYVGFTHYARVAKEAPGFTVFTGADGTLLGCLMIGGHGIIGGTVNAAPALERAVYDAFKAGDYEKASKLQRKLTQVVDVCKIGPGPACYKAPLVFHGLCGGYMTHPLQWLTADQTERTRKGLKELGVL
jgi:hypothetical protein